MLVGVMSDTHDRLPLIDRALELFDARGVELIVHLGDLVAPFAARRFVDLKVPVCVLYGNNDGERPGLKEVLPQIADGPVFRELGGRNLLLHHFVDWCPPQALARADAVLSGHTHQVVNERVDGKLFLNPGECCGWVTGRCSVTVLDTETLSADICDLEP